MEGCGMVSLQALKWLWALNPSFPSADVPQGVPPIPYIGSASPSGPLDSDTKGARINGGEISALCSCTFVCVCIPVWVSILCRILPSDYHVPQRIVISVLSLPLSLTLPAYLLLSYPPSLLYSLSRRTTSTHYVCHGGQRPAPLPCRHRGTRPGILL